VCGDHAGREFGRRFSDENAFFEGKEPHAVQLRQAPTTQLRPGAAAVRGADHDADAQPRKGHRGSADDPTDAVAEKADAPQRAIGRAGKELPGAAAVVGAPNDAVIADGPTDALVNELHVVQVRIVLNGDRRDRAGRVALVGRRGA
jgi:hypothetical protein